jgi:hypothetical protein
VLDDGAKVVHVTIISDWSAKNIKIYSIILYVYGAEQSRSWSLSGCLVSALPTGKTLGQNPDVYTRCLY